MSKQEIKHIIPAILPKSFQELENGLMLVAKSVPWVQIDVVDGVFAPNKTWPYINDDAGKFLRFVKQEEGLPFWDDVNFEIDLMVADPTTDVDKWIAVGASRLVIHIEGLAEERLVGIAKNIKEKGVELVLAVSINTPIESLKSAIEAIKAASDVENFGNIDGIQCMGIDRVGFQGQEFDRAVIGKIKEIRALYPNVTISVDGAVHLENARVLRDAGADRLIVGSAILESEDVADTILHFEEVAA